jgi:2-hydroxymuconate-semialdehyde hydrolase
MTIEKVNLKTGIYETHLNKTGEGEAILFIHGSGPGASAFSNWQHALPEFGRKYLSLAPDLIGFGESTHPDSPPEGMRAWMRLWVDQMLNLLNELEIEKAHIVGNSLGGAVALHLLMEAPERFDKVVLMGPVGAPVQLPVELDRIWGFYEDPTEVSMRNAIRWFAYDESFIEDRLTDIARMRLDAALQPGVRRSFEAMFPAPRQRHLDELVVPESALNRITHPVFILHGKDDKIVPYTTSLYFMEHLPNARLYLLGRSSHWIQIEHKEAFHSQLWNFFEGEI